ncbi:MAG TPA: DNA sulfur modification protein DndD [Nocardioides sp.]|uniref:DNA sulfur modification protein DndD n=1 Tax=Nocardioides sp. TaxID=35761 RepID=UPI002B7088E0|nr:DNA sulfur modification protein DndD [Nocardioides sp.]HTW16171.1 DNA sulfur modification protein DndD [Nocardioides sp.]
MLVRQIHLHNFKAYRGTHVLNLAEPTRNANVYLFGGENGAGKTTLVQAVLLALYGVGASGLPGMPRQGRDFRRRYAEWLAAGCSAGARGAHDDLMSVGVVLQDGDSRVDVKRSIWFRADGSVEEELLEVREDREIGSELYSGEDAQERVAIWMPRHLAELIFFDGEQVRSKLGDDSGSIADALDRLLDLEPIKKLTSDIARLSRDRRTALLSETQVDVLDAWERELGALTEALRENQLNERERRMQADDLEESLATVQAAIDERLSGSSPITTVQIDAELTSLRGRRDELRSRFGRGLGEWLYLGMFPDLLRDVSIDLASEQDARAGRERRKLQAEASDKFAARLLAGLSGRMPPAAVEEVERLTVQLRGDLSEGADACSSDELSSGLGVLSDEEVAAALSTAKTLDKRDVEDIQYLAQDLTAIQAEIGKLETRRLELAEQGAVDRLLVRAQELRDGLSELRAQLGATELAAAEKRDKVAELERSIARLTARAEDSDSANRWLAAADLLTRGLRAYADERRRLALAGVSKALLRRLKDLLHKQHLVTAVEIDPVTYETQLFGRGGRKVHLPSAGEHQLTAMAFGAAILDCSDSALPMFIDTPLARLDASHRTNVVERFWPRVGRQVFVLSTDEEVRGTLLEGLRPYIVETFVILHDDAVSESRIVAGDYFAEGKA